MPPSPSAALLRQARYRARIVLITAAHDRHARQLRAAFLRRDVEAVLLPLEACAFATESPSGLRLGEFDGLPEGVFVRTIAEGSFEAVTRRLGILHALKALGVPVWNEATAIERCVDKSTTTFLLARAGLPVPATWAVEGIEAARRIVAAEASVGPLVLKPLFGAQGRGLMLIREAAELPPAETIGNVYYLQRFVGGDGPDYHDFRVFVVQGEPVAAMLRHSHEWITNVKRGGRPLPHAARHGARNTGVGSSESGRCGLLRRRHHSRQGPPPLRARSELNAGLVRPAERHGDQDRRPSGRAVHRCLAAAEASEGRLMGLSPDVIAEAYRLACLDELSAPKAGNVHDFSDGHGMTVGDFEISAGVTKDWIARPGAKVGERVRGAIAATRKAVDANTNLGIVLMSAPLARAAEREGAGDLPAAVGRELEELDVVDADNVFQAIVLAAPAGLGEAAENDVRAPAAVTLLEAMRTAEDRDRIAWNYTHGFDDVFRLGIPTFRRALAQWNDWLVGDGGGAFRDDVRLSGYAHLPRARRRGGGSCSPRCGGDPGQARAMTDDPAVLMDDILALDRRLKARRP